MRYLALGSKPFVGGASDIVQNSFLAVIVDMVTIYKQGHKVPCIWTTKKG